MPVLRNRSEVRVLANCHVAQLSLSFVVRRMAAAPGRLTRRRARDARPSLAHCSDDVVALIAYSLADALFPSHLCYLSATCRSLKTANVKVVTDLRQVYQQVLELMRRQFRCTILEFTQNPDMSNVGHMHRDTKALFALAFKGILRSEVMKKKKELQMQNVRNGIGAALVDAAACGHLRRIEKLFFLGNQLGDANVQALAASCSRGLLPKLQSLDLLQNGVGDAGLAALVKALPKLPALRYLGLGCNRITDIGMREVAEATGKGWLKNLEGLSLCGTQVGDEGTVALMEAAASGTLPELLQISLQGQMSLQGTLTNDRNTFLRDAGYAALARTIAAGGLPSLISLIVDEPEDEDLSNELALACNNANVHFDFPWRTTLQGPVV